MNFFTNIEDTQITRGARKAFDAFIPVHRRLFPIEPCPREVARAAVRGVLGWGYPGRGLTAVPCLPGAPRAACKIGFALLRARFRLQ